jgi:RNA polymerase sigma-70 factor (ECF subfamily)
LKYAEADIIAGCLRNSAKHQEALYQKYASKMMAVCLRYAYTNFEAEDIFQEAFVKVFSKLNSYENKGSFEGWIRHIFVNTALNHYSKNKKHYQQADIVEQIDVSYEEVDIISRLSHEELLAIIRELPEGYRLVFNLSVLEGYTHKEIGTLLGINEGTSKSQLSKAKAILQKKLLQYKTINSHVV